MADETLNDLLTGMMGTGYYAPETPAPRAQRSAELDAVDAATVELARQLFVVKMNETAGIPFLAGQLLDVSRRCLWAALSHEANVTHILQVHGGTATHCQYEDYEDFVASIL